MNKVLVLAKHPLISGSTIMLIGSFIASILNYISNLIMGRLLSIEDYGLLISLTSFVMLFGTINNSLSHIFTRFFATHAAREDSSGIKPIFLIGFKLVLILSIVILLTLSFLTNFIANFLNINNNVYLFIMYVSIAVAVVATLPSGLLQGKMKFFLISIIGVFPPIIKILFGVTLVILGYGVFGALIGFLLATLIPTVIFYIYFMGLFKAQKTKIFNKIKFLKELKSYGFTFVFASAGITFLSNTDVIFVRNLFDPLIAGQYAALSLMGKAIFYVTSPISFVFFPLIAYKKEKKEKLVGTILLAAVTIILASVTLSFVYFMFPGAVLSIFFPGEGYKVLAPYLGPFSLYILLFSLVYLLNNFFLSIGKTGVYKITLVAFFLQIALFYIFHRSLFQIIGVLFTMSFLILIALLIYYWKNRDK